MTNALQKPIKQRKPLTPDTSYICVKAASPGYKFAHVYRCYQRADGVSCLMGDDGFEDPTTMLESTFQPFTTQLHVVK